MFQISRSGRVIKPKKFLYDEEEKEDGEGKGKPKQCSSPVKENVEMIREDGNDVQKKQRKSKAKSDKSEKSEMKDEARPVLSKIGRLMWARTKNGELVQIMIDHDRPVFKVDCCSRASPAIPLLRV